MKFDKAKDPVACAAREETRYAISGASIVRIGERDYIAATDGRVLSLVTCELEDGDDAQNVYPSAAFAQARKAAPRGKAFPDARLTLNGTARLQYPDGATSEFKPLEKRFPDVEGVVPKGKPDVAVNLNAELLAKLAKALGSASVRLEFYRDDGDKEHPGTLGNMPVLVTPLHLGKGDGRKDGSYGVIMPIAES